MRRVHILRHKSIHNRFQDSSRRSQDLLELAAWEFANQAERAAMSKVAHNQGLHFLIEEAEWDQIQPRVQYPSREKLDSRYALGSLWAKVI